MPYLQLADARIWYEDTGSGKGTLLFGHGLLFDHQLYDAQVEVLKPHYRCIRFDFRAHGKSTHEGGAITIDTLVDDVLALARELNVGSFHYIGFSMGGFVGLRLAGRHPEKVKSLVLIDTSAEPEPRANLPRYKLLLRVAKWFGLRLVGGRVMKILFGPKFLNDPGRAALRKKWKQIITSNKKEYAARAVEAVIQREGVSKLLPAIKAPTMILVGDQDIATTPAKARHMQEGIAGARLHLIAGSGHASPIEEPGQVNEWLTTFFAKHIPK